MLEIKHVLQELVPTLHLVFGENTERFNEEYNFISTFLDDMFMLYNMGKRQNLSGSNKLTVSQLAAYHPELTLSGEADDMLNDLRKKAITLLYNSYCNGYDSM